VAGEWLFMEYLSLFTNIATLAAAVAAFLAIWEMRAQRRSTYVPRLAIDDTHFELRQGSRQPDKLDPNSEPSGDRFARSVRITNVGLGPARNVTAEYKYDFDQFVKLIGNLDIKKSFEIETNVGGSVGPFLSISWPAGHVGGSLHNLRPYKPAIKALLPLMQDPSADWQLELPSHYLAIFEVWAWFEVSKICTETTPRGVASVQISQPLPLTLQITYSDIANNVFHETFAMGFHIGAISGNPDFATSRTVEIRVKVSET
jgi:hypothetical protein